MTVDLKGYTTMTINHETMNAVIYDWLKVHSGIFDEVEVFEVEELPDGGFLIKMREPRVVQEEPTP